MRLPGLEGVQSDEEPGRVEERALAHAVRLPDGVLGRIDDDGMIHDSDSSKTMAVFAGSHAGMLPRTDEVDGGLERTR